MALSWTITSYVFFSFQTCLQFHQHLFNFLCQATDDGRHVTCVSGTMSAVFQVTLAMIFLPCHLTIWQYEVVDYWSTCKVWLLFHEISQLKAITSAYICVACHECVLPQKHNYHFTIIVAVNFRFIFGGTERKALAEQQLQQSGQPRRPLLAV